MFPWMMNRPRPPLREESTDVIVTRWAKGDPAKRGWQEGYLSAARALRTPAAHQVLGAHEHDSWTGGCTCGWNDYGRTHASHVLDQLAGLLEESIDPETSSVQGA